MKADGADARRFRIAGAAKRHAVFLSFAFVPETNLVRPTGRGQRCKESVVLDDERINHADSVQRIACNLLCAAGKFMRNSIFRDRLDSSAVQPRPIFVS